jgi:hypothetical protein
VIRQLLSYFHGFFTFADVNQEDKDGATPLHFAARFKSMKKQVQDVVSGHHHLDYKCYS